MADSPSKRVELELRKKLYGLLKLTGGRSARTHPPALPSHPRILLVRHDRFGDAIVSTPSMKLLRERFPQARIDILLGHRNHTIAPLLPCIDTAHVVGRGIRGLRAIASELKPVAYDVVVNLLAKESTSGAILSIVSGARYRIGFDDGVASVYDYRVPRPAGTMHIVRETSLLLAPLGIEAIGQEPVREAEYLSLQAHSDAARQGRQAKHLRVVVSVSSPSDARSWADASFVALIDALRSPDTHFFVVGTPDDAARVRGIATAAGADALAPVDTFAAFVGQLAGFDVLVTPQTSTVHVGSALRIPVVVLNTDSESDRQWLPWGVPYRTVSSGPAVASIPVDHVVRSLASLLDEVRASRV